MSSYNELSKKLGHDDSSGFNFAKEMLGNNPTAAINFDRFLFHKGKPIIMEYLLCDENQPRVTPYTSHPKWYWRKNSRKFLSLWRAALCMGATLYLINYAKKGTAHDDEVLVIEVLDMNEKGITKEVKTKYNRADFQEWFIKINNESLEGDSDIYKEIIKLMNDKKI